MDSVDSPAVISPSFLLPGLRKSRSCSTDPVLAVGEAHSLERKALYGRHSFPAVGAGRRLVPVNGFAGGVPNRAAPG